jgi:prefoldin beta subunit
MAELTEQQKEMIGQFQAYQQQLQSILIQKESLRLHGMEMDKAIEELNATKEERAFKITGNIMISKPVSELKKDLQESKEALEIRIKSLEKTEERANSKLKELQDKLREIA